jgi:hypothetical protein
MERKYNRRDDLLASADLRTKKRRAGEAIQAFEKIIDRPVPNPRAPKIKKPKYDRLRRHEVVLYEAPSIVRRVPPKWMRNSRRSRLRGLRQRRQLHSEVEEFYGVPQDRNACATAVPPPSHRRVPMPH